MIKIDADGFYWQVFKGHIRYLALAKKEPFIYFAKPLSEPGELWFEFGPTAPEAYEKLRESLGLETN